MNSTPPTIDRAITRLAIPYDLFCQECGYNLRGLTSNRCPECGHELDALRLRESRIPWMHRDKLGWFRAYWKTVFWVGFQYRRFCEEVAREVDYASAQSFRWITIAHAFVPLIGLLLAGIFNTPRDGFLIPPRWVFPTDGGTLVLAALTILLGLTAMTGVPSYLFDVRSMPVRQRNRVLAMSYYCGAALSWTPLLAMLWALRTAIVTPFETVEIGLSLLVFFLALTLLVDWWMNLFRTARRVMPQYPLRRWAVALLTPILWIVAWVVAVAGAGFVNIGAFFVYQFFA